MVYDGFVCFYVRLFFLVFSFWSCWDCYSIPENFTVSSPYQLRVVLVLDYNIFCCELVYWSLLYGRIKLCFHD